MRTRTRVLIVDDDDDLRALVRDVLVEEGYAVRELPSVDGISDELADVSLVLLDTGHPGRYTPVSLPADHPPIVVFSASNDADQVAISLAAVDVVRKPFELETLLASVRRHAGAPAV